MKRKIKTAPIAQKDLIKAVAYYQQCEDTELSARFLTSAKNLYGLIGSFPMLGKEFDLDVPTLTGIRVAQIPGFNRYEVFYRIEPEAIRIIRVLDSSRNIFEFFEA